MLADRREDLARVKERGGHATVVVDVAAKCMVSANCIAAQKREST